MTEALPLPITSMLPMVGLPLLGLMSTGQVTFHNIYISISTYLHIYTGCRQLPERHQLHVPGRPHHGHSGGALRPPQPSGAQDYHDGGHISTHYLHYIYTLSTLYLHNIYILSTQYLHII